MTRTPSWTTIQLRIICSLFLIPFFAFGASGDFIRLKDGTIALVIKETPTSLLLKHADGKTETIDQSKITGRIKPAHAARLVDKLIAIVGQPKHHEKVKADAIKLGMAAVPRILNTIANSKNPSYERVGALSLLQFVWSTEAESALINFVGDAEPQVRSWGWHLAKRHLSQEQQLSLLEKLSSSKNPKIAFDAITKLLAEKPNPTHIRKAITDKKNWPALHPHLPRYYDEALAPPIRRMLEQGNPKEQESALCSLIYQFASAKESRKLIVKHVRSPTPEIRDLASEFLRWHGKTEDLDLLTQALAQEEDLHVKASIQEAVKMIKYRKEHPLTKVTLDLPDFEPFHKYRGHDPKTATQKSPEHLRVESFREHTGYSSLNSRNSNQATPPLDQIPPSKLIPPVREYFAFDRKNYALPIGADGGPFANSIHVGDDVAWDRQHHSVVAIGNGIVRRALTAAPSWGGFVIIEHPAANGKPPFCSLYGHLGPLVAVKTGQAIKKGTKIGSLGCNYSLSTGGYMTHLHFGIHLGPYESGRWITGYMNPRKFNNQKHSWVDPQFFLRARL